MPSSHLLLGLDGIKLLLVLTGSSSYDRRKAKLFLPSMPSLLGCNLSEDTVRHSTRHSELMIVSPFLSQLSVLSDRLAN